MTIDKSDIARLLEYKKEHKDDYIKVINENLARHKNPNLYLKKLNDIQDLMEQVEYQVAFYIVNRLMRISDLENLDAVIELATYFSKGDYVAINKLVKIDIDKNIYHIKDLKADIVGDIKVNGYETEYGYIFTPLLYCEKEYIMLNEHKTMIKEQFKNLNEVYRYMFKNNNRQVINDIDNYLEKKMDRPSIRGKDWAIYD